MSLVNSPTLLTLPREIRDIIYIFSIRWAPRSQGSRKQCSCCTRGYSCSLDPDIPNCIDQSCAWSGISSSRLATRTFKLPPISYACRQTYHEVVPMILRSTKFVLNSGASEKIIRWLNNLPFPDGFDLVRRVTVPCLPQYILDEEDAFAFLKQCTRLEALTLEVIVGGAVDLTNPPATLLQDMIQDCRLSQIVSLPLPTLKTLQISCDDTSPIANDFQKGFFALDRIAPPIEAWFIEQWAKTDRRVKTRNLADENIGKWLEMAEKIRNDDLKRWESSSMRAMILQDYAEALNFHQARVASR